MSDATAATVWSQPLERGQFRSALIALCVEICRDGGPDFLTAHWLFARKVLRETQADAMGLAAHFRFVPITDVDACERLADEWWEPT